MKIDWCTFDPKCNVVEPGHLHITLKTISITTIFFKKKAKIYWIYLQHTHSHSFFCSNWWQMLKFKKNNSFLINRQKDNFKSIKNVISFIFYDNYYSWKFHSISFPSAEIRTLLCFWFVITVTWLWGGLHLAYGQLWMLVMFCIFNIIQVRVRLH